MNNSKAVFVLLVAVLAAGCLGRPVAKGPREVSVQGTFDHEVSGMTFPETVGEFRRTSVKQFDAAGRNVAAGYNLLRLGSAIALSVYVYPGPVDVRLFPWPRIGGIREDVIPTFFSDVKTAVVTEHPGANLVRENTVTLTQGKVTLSGHHAVFQFDGSTPYGTQKFQSEAFLFARGRWFVKCRATYLAGYAEQCEKDTVAFLQEWALPAAAK